MTVQTTYDRYIGKAYAGQLADGFNPKYVKSLIAEGAVIYGRTVSQGTADDQAVQAGTPPIGIAIRDLNNENNIGSVSTQYDDEQVMAVLEEGYVYIALANTGAKGAAIFSTDATGIISVGTAGAGQTQLTGSFLDETIAAAGVARIFLKRL
jgi:hypothetical protein